ncbi:hypothetical protein AGLY_007922 [Aphis glycines]|uniref:Uncharacterized protein n=1 Tax=Aphis glycines TaxID=307491 RepID=A0A6G0TM94_APHGL|nr:hypothetical protein AGLY_007922 [Aphis glycines]
MMCFFLSVYSITFRNNTSISNSQKLKVNIFQQFSTKSIFFYGYNSKTNHLRYLKFSPNVYISFIYVHVDTLQNIIQGFLEVVLIVIKKNQTSLVTAIFFISFIVQIFIKYIKISKIIRRTYLRISSPLKHKPPFIPTAGNFQIFTKSVENAKICKLTNHLRSESFFVYNDTYHCIQIESTLVRGPPHPLMYSRALD